MCPATTEHDIIYTFGHTTRNTWTFPERGEKLHAQRYYDRILISFTSNTWSTTRRLATYEVVPLEGVTRGTEEVRVTTLIGLPRAPPALYDCPIPVKGKEVMLSCSRETLVHVRFKLLIVDHAIIQRSKTSIDFSLPSESSDVTLVLSGKKVHVHKSFLAAHSAYFAALFYDNFAERYRKEIELKDIDYETFLEFLRLIYPGDGPVKNLSALREVSAFFACDYAQHLCGIAEAQRRKLEEAGEAKFFSVAWAKGAAVLVPYGLLVFLWPLPVLAVSGVLAVVYAGYAYACYLNCYV